VTVALLLVTGLLVPALGASASGHRDLIEWVHAYNLFSPNGDGRRDTVRFVFDLAHGARVTAGVRASGGTLLHAQSLHRLDSGRHHWTWDGRSDDGTVVADGSYDIWIRARRGAVTQTLKTRAVADTVAQGRLVTSRPTLYPRAQIVDDQIQLVYVAEGWSPYVVWVGEDFQPRTELRILNHRDKVVRQEVVKDSATPTFTWDARRTDGTALPEGTYRARLRTIDQAGNLLRLSQRITVSYAQLVEQVWSNTVPASTAGRFYPWFDLGCNDCYNFASPVASERYPGGLSFRPNESTWGTSGYFLMELPFTAAPVDTYRITAVGGPTLPGASDVGALSGVLMRGDSTASSPWFHVDLVDYPYLPVGEAPIHWTFGTTPPNSYDVATFSVEYRYYVPTAS
jgi:flagellar hook assembly protein FlgD